MSNTKAHRYKALGGPRLIWLQALAVAVILLIVLTITLRLLYTLWPGSDWVQVWHDGANRRLAAETVAEAGGKRIAEALDLVARLDAADAKPLPAAQLTTVNATLAYAQQIIVRCAHACDEPCIGPPPSASTVAQTQVRASISVSAIKPAGLVATAALGAGPVPPTAPETWIPLGPTTPTRRQLTTIREHLLLAQKLLVCRLRSNQTPVAQPGFWDILWQHTPSESAPWTTRKAGAPRRNISTNPEWQLLPDEVALYNKTYQSTLELRPPAFLGSSELNYLAIIFLFGVLGACIRGLASLSKYVGNLSFEPRWSLYYIAQPLVGGGLAMAFYAVLRGGFMNTESSAALVTNLYACSALGVLVGVATQEALTKIANVAGQLFADAQDVNDKNKLHQPRSDTVVPVIQNVQLSADGLSGTVTGLRLQNARQLFIGSRNPLILASGPTCIYFRTDGLGRLVQADLKSIFVETDHGGSAVFDDTTPDQPPPPSV
ncbi:MAG: hypothetical protein H7067_18850 [Burkholderiales bacterium]|nr:hypothetical protein [Opitutaceae bacterium]